MRVLLDDKMPQTITRQGLERHLYRETGEEITLERDDKRVTGRLCPEGGPINSLGILSFGTPFTIFADNHPDNPLTFVPNRPLGQSNPISLKNSDKVYIGSRPYITKGLKYTYEP